ncbi:type II secretion system F family protein [Endozoicomonas sp. SM1973]|uniref:Type II secretion system F family protein n=2 Tax=Spartinivicinus marinus TaxID=2994442 RepID=A0A853I3A8_9GAMM|nr:type II secretion system F family protein [Spartinivicinus marinus]MCX4028644.1 type II secretion system F family protein [Spartinivicinus marinus]NYZ67089.1 type II secretion system F family protein [Spartinivicinus marinus]
MPKPGYPTKHSLLSHQQRAHLFMQLSRLEQSGLSMEHTLNLLSDGDDQVAKRASFALKDIKRGQPLSTAGKRAGLLTERDAYLITVAEAGGVHTAIFRQLAEIYQTSASQLKQIKSRLVFPIVILICAVFIRQFPALFQGNITLFTYIAGNLFLLGQLGAIAYIGWRLPYWIRYGFLGALKGSWDKLTIHFPYFGNWYVRIQTRDFIQALGLLLQAGLPIMEAIPKAYRFIENQLLREQFEEIEQSLQAGNNFTQAFSSLENTASTIVQLISTGEHAGDLSGMMLRCANMETEQINLYTSMVTEWVPRLVYVLIAVWIAYGIIKGGAPMTTVP